MGLATGAGINVPPHSDACSFDLELISGARAGNESPTGLNPGSWDGKPSALPLSYMAKR